MVVTVEAHKPSCVLGVTIFGRIDCLLSIFPFSSLLSYPSVLANLVLVAQPSPHLVAHTGTRTQGHAHRHRHMLMQTHAHTQTPLKGTHSHSHSHFGANERRERTTVVQYTTLQNGEQCSHATQHSKLLWQSTHCTFTVSYREHN